VGRSEVDITFSHGWGGVHEGRRATLHHWEARGTLSAPDNANGKHIGAG
jgi:hypothetical protein